MLEKSVDHKLSFPVSCHLTFSRCTILKIGVTIVCTTARLCIMCVRVCLHRCQKTFSCVYNMCLCWEWMQVVVHLSEGHREAPQSALLFITLQPVTKCGSHERQPHNPNLEVVIFSSAEASAFIAGQKTTITYLLCLTRGVLLCALCEGDNKHERFVLKIWHQLEQKTSVILSK